MTGAPLHAALLAMLMQSVTPLQQWAPPLPSAFANGRAADQASLARWWTGYGDPALDRLVERASAANLDVAAAAARVEQARALLSRARAERSPDVELGLLAARERLSALETGSGGRASSHLEARANASWEPDLFGRLAKGVRAARADLQAVSDDRTAMHVTVTGEVVRRYLAAVGLDTEIAVVRRNAAAQAQTASLTRRLFQAGAVPIVDVQRAEALAAATTAEVAPLERERAINVDALALLAALPVSEVQSLIGRQIPSARLAVVSGAAVPAELLRARPDVRAAEARLLAAAERLGVARAELKPRLNLLGIVGVVTGALGGFSFGSALTWLAGGQVSAPLFDGGRRRSVVALRKAELDESIALYRRSVLAALADTEDALADVDASQRRMAAIIEAERLASLALVQVERAWKAGEVPILDVLDAQRAALAQQQALAREQAALGTAQARLATALGGDPEA